MVFGIIEGRRRGEDKPDLLSMLLHAVDEETGEKMTDAQLRDEVLTLFSAGHETTANLLSWTLLLLIENADVEEQLRAELLSWARADGGARALDALLRLPLLDAVLKESMRIYPPIPIVTRACEADDVLDGVVAHKGDYVFCAPWSVHRHPKLWPDPLRFDPGRFLVEDPARPRYAHFPFLGGPRKCIGDQLALLEAKLILASLLPRYAFARADRTPVVPEATVSLRPKHGLRVTISPRSP
jgi:cytochrome P450